MSFDEQTSAQAVCRKAHVALRSYRDIEDRLAATSAPPQELLAKAEASSAELHVSLADVEKCGAVTADDIEAKLDVIDSVRDMFGEGYSPLIGLTLSTLKEVRHVLIGNHPAQDFLAALARTMKIAPRSHAERRRR